MRNTVDFLERLMEPRKSLLRMRIMKIIGKGELNQAVHISLLLFSNFWFKCCSSICTYTTYVPYLCSRNLENFEVFVEISYIVVLQFTKLISHECGFFVTFFDFTSCFNHQEVRMRARCFSSSCLS